MNLEALRDSSPGAENGEIAITSLQRTKSNDVLDRQAQQLALRKAKSLEQRVSLPREIAVVTCICLAMFTTQASLGICLNLLHVIGDSFGITNSGVLSWLIAGYCLTVGTFILFTGRLGDLFGWKLMLVIGFAWHAVWSLVCGLSVYSDHVLFVFARVLQGFGPAIVLPNGVALLGNLYHPGQRQNMAFSIIGACAPVGFIVGGALGGLFALAWWPWAFFSLAIALAIFGVASALIIPDPQDKKPGRRIRSMSAAVEDLDLHGAIAGTAALILFNFAWNQAPIVGWDEAYIIVCLILGIALIPLFFHIEISVSRKPILPIEVFTCDNAFMLGSIACGWATFGIWIYYLWKIQEVIHGASPLLAVAQQNPNAVGGVIAAISSGLLLGVVRPAWAMTTAMCAFLIGILLTATVPPDHIYWGQVFVATFVTPFGMDISFPAATIVISNSMRKEHQGVAASLVNTIVNYSISLGLGISGTIEAHVNRGGKTPSDVLRGYRGAMYFGIGTAAPGMAVAIFSVVKTYWDNCKKDLIVGAVDRPDHKV